MSYIVQFTSYLRATNPALLTFSQPNLTGTVRVLAASRALLCPITCKMFTSILYKEQSHSLGIGPMNEIFFIPRQLFEDQDHVFRCPSQASTHYIWSCKIFAAPLNKKNHQLVLSCEKVSHIGCPIPLSPCPLISPGTRDALSWSSKCSINRNALVGAKLFAAT